MMSESNKKKEAFESKKQEASGWMVIVYGIIIFAITYALFLIKYGETYVNDIIQEFKTETTQKTIMGSFTKNLGFLLAILAAVYGIVILHKAAILDNDIKGKAALDALISVFMIGVPVIGLTMLTIYNVPLMIRTFENTLGYSWINGADLRTITTNMFGSSGYGEDTNYNIVTTQLFEENYGHYLSSMKKGVTNSLNRFGNVFLDESYFKEGVLNLDIMTDENKENAQIKNLYDLLKMVVKKRHISDAIWISLAGIVTVYASML